MTDAGPPYHLRSKSINWDDAREPLMPPPDDKAYLADDLVMQEIVGRRPWGSEGYPPLHEALWDEADNHRDTDLEVLLRDAGDEIKRLQERLDEVEAEWPHGG